MNRLTNAEMADMHLSYGAANGNSRQAARIYEDCFPNRYIPGHRMFTNLHQRLRDTGRFEINRLDAGRQRRVDVEEAVLDHFERNPRASMREAAAVLGFQSHWAVSSALNANNFHTRHFQRVYALNSQDYETRVQFSEWYLNKEFKDPKFSERVLFSDEATFTHFGVVNLHDHELQINNPRIVREQGYKRRYSVNIWAGIIHNQIIGPYILQSPLNGNNYRIFLERVLPELLENVPLSVRRRMWYQQDGALAHFHIGVRNYLHAQFPDRWIGQNGPVAWPQRSPDMTPLDFFYWRHMKNLVYETPVESEEDLVARIVVASGDISEMPGLFPNIRQSLRRRYQKCIDVGGTNFEQYL